MYKSCNLRKERRNSILGSETLFSEDQTMFQSFRALISSPLFCKNSSVSISDSLNLTILKTLSFIPVFAKNFRVGYRTEYKTVKKPWILLFFPLLSVKEKSELGKHVNEEPKNLIDWQFLTCYFIKQGILTFLCQEHSVFVLSFLQEWVLSPLRQYKEKGIVILLLVTE